MNKPHILITGERGIGKSTLVNKLLNSCEQPLYGYRTKTRLNEKSGIRSVHIYPVNMDNFLDTEINCVASAHMDTCKTGMVPQPSVFDTLGVEYLNEVCDGGLIVMDELGFLETDAKEFCQKVLECLDGDIPVLAVVRLNKETGFLNTVRRHPKAELYTVTEENRDELVEVLMGKMKENF